MKEKQFAKTEWQHRTLIKLPILTLLFMRPSGYFSPLLIWHTSAVDIVVCEKSKSTVQKQFAIAPSKVLS